MVLSWLRERRRRKLLATPMPGAWREIIAQNVAGYAALSDAEQRQLEDATRVFVAEKRWDGGRGVEITDEVKLTVAAQACLMILGFDDGLDRFHNVRDIVAVESAYDDTTGQDRETSTPNRLGHTSHYGAVFLAWDSARHGGRDPRDGRNLVYHEFSHKLDLDDGVADGTPILDGRVKLRTWIDVMTAAYDELCEQTDRNRPTLLDQYGATNTAEFFAVATECFFEKARQLRERHPDLYRILSAYYRQDPAERWAASARFP